MRSNQNHTYVLVAGAWHGSWVWRDVIPSLREMGHTVTAPTLTGLGERRHLGTDDTNLSTHIEDVIAHIEMEDLRDVTLVGWSYGGMVITGVNAKLPQLVRSMIFLDAFVPEPGKALVDYLSVDIRAFYDRFMKAREPLPALPMEALGVTDQALIDFVSPRLTLQPWRTLYEPSLAKPPRDKPVSYVYCAAQGETPITQFYDRLKADPDVRTAVIETGHTCMLSEPQKTIDALVNLA